MHCVERPKKPEYDWFQFFLSCEVAVGLCDRYAQIFAKDSMDESVLADVDATVLRTLGIREGDIIKVMRTLDKRFGRPSGKRNVSFGGEEEIGESSGGIFSGPGGTLRNNTSKGRPAPAVQTNNVVDAKAFSQPEPKSALSESVATPLTSVPPPITKDVVRSGFDDDAWDVKPSRQQPQTIPSQPAQSAPAPAPVPAPQQPTLTGAMHELSLLSQPLEPIRQQQTAASTPQQQPQISGQPQASQPPPQIQAPQVTPSFFEGIGGQQTGVPQQQQLAPMQFTQSTLPQNIARQRPTPPQYQNHNLSIPAPPSRPLSAPQVNPTGGFGIPPPLQAQSTGMQTSSGFQQIAPPGQSLDDLRMRQQFTGFNGPQNQQMGGMMAPSAGFQYNGMQQPQQQNGFQYTMQTGMQHQPFMNGSPFADPRPQQFSPIQQQPTGFQSSFGPPQQQYQQPTGVNSFLPPPLQPTATGMQSQNNGFNQNFQAPPMPSIPQHVISPLVPQKTGPPPPVRFGVTGDTKKLMPQATGRRANLSQASELFIPQIFDPLTVESSAKSLWVLVH